MGAIVFRVLAEHSTWGATHFPTIPKALETLLLKVTLSGTKGGPVIADGWDENFFFGFLLLVFSLVANVTIMGVLGGLLVQTVKTVAEVEKEESQVKSMRLSMDNLWEDLVKGQADTASICERQLRQNLKRTHIVKALQGIGVDLEGLVNASGFVFEQHEGHLSKPQFKRMLMDQRGKNAAKVKDHVETRRFIDMMFKRNGRKTTKTDSITTQTDNVGPA
uniref:Ion transport domain-containing protein n=1 Tax=Pyrodinium bahamense TaxID=73915 RepID=A0A7S0B7Y5_9DINO|mmetsp:Transcript_538/g.1458  ORF Transcript_538/g.1458 Transcript_538/m.1458 type:complete len:220 (+) Transcript_538:2-661(+)